MKLCQECHKDGCMIQRRTFGKCAACGFSAWLVDCLKTKVAVSGRQENPDEYRNKYYEAHGKRGRPRKKVRE